MTLKNVVLSLPFICFNGVGGANINFTNLGSASIHLNESIWERSMDSDMRRHLLFWGSSKKVKEKLAEDAVDKVRGFSPFVLLFSSGAGSSWLWQSLATTPGICMLGYEPLADCGKDQNSNLEKKLTWMRVAMSTPGGHNDKEQQARWSAWNDKLAEKALECRTKEVKASFDGRRCDARRTFAAGFRLRVTRPLGRSEKWPLLKATFREFGVKVVWMKRRNPLQQALAEYNAMLRNAGHTVKSSFSMNFETSLLVFGGGNSDPLARSCLKHFIPFVKSSCMSVFSHSSLFSLLVFTSPLASHSIACNSSGNASSAGLYRCGWRRTS